MTGHKTKTTHDKLQCGGAKRQGQPGPCTRPAGWGTTHPGEGKCKLHGGNNPITTGRYSTIKRPRLAELIAQFTADPDPTNLLPEAVLLRALVLDYIERYDQFTQALFDWHESYVDKNKTPNPKPQQVIDILSVGKFIGEIAGLVEKIDKQKQKGFISLEAVNRYVEQLGLELSGAAQEAKLDGDSATAFFNAIDRRWSTVSIDAKPGGKGTA